METDEMIARIRAAIQRRVAVCDAEGKAAQKAKWLAEERALTLPSHAEALARINFAPEALEGMAIYVTQKVRRMVSAFLGVGGPDPYTTTVLCNAAELGATIRNQAMRASLTDKLPTDEKLSLRRKASDGTAQTQASSTRQALIALGAAHVEGGGRHAALKIDFGHPFVAKLVQE